MATAQRVVQREPKLLEHNLTLTIRCECGAVRNFGIEKLLQAVANHVTAGVIFDTECAACHRKFSVGLGLHDTNSGWSKRLPEYLQATTFDIKDDEGLVPPKTS